MRGKRNTDRKAKKSITIADMDVWDRIDKIMATFPEYAKSQNKVLNDLIAAGLPVLEDKLFGEVRLPEEGQAVMIRKDSEETEMFYGQVVRLLKEINLNANINKSILSSLFNGRAVELKGKGLSSFNFTSGALADTPDYLSAYECRELKKLQEDSKK